MIKFTVIPKKAIWHVAIWQNWCFGQFYQSRIEVLQNCSAFFVSVSLMRGKFEGTRESILENSGHSPCYFISVIFYKVRSGFKLFFGVQLSRHVIYFLYTKF